LIQSLVQKWLASPTHRELMEVVQTSGALPVYEGMGGTLLLRPDGEILVLTDDSIEPEVESDPVWRLIAVVVGAEKYPDLRSLLPVRPPGTPDCDFCGGCGRLRLGTVESNVMCGSCNGLGWSAAIV
jgi:hypothetical protein